MRLRLILFSKRWLWLPNNTIHKFAFLEISEYMLCFFFFSLFFSKINVTRQRSLEAPGTRRMPPMPLKPPAGHTSQEKIIIWESLFWLPWVHSVSQNLLSIFHVYGKVLGGRKIIILSIYWVIDHMPGNEQELWILQGSFPVYPCCYFREKRQGGILEWITACSTQGDLTSVRANFQSRNNSNLPTSSSCYEDYIN